VDAADWAPGYPERAHLAGLVKQAPAARPGVRPARWSCNRSGLGCPTCPGRLDSPVPSTSRIPSPAPRPIAPRRDDAPRSCLPSMSSCRSRVLLLLCQRRDSHTANLRLTVLARCLDVAASTQKWLISARRGPGRW